MVFLYHRISQVFPKIFRQLLGLRPWVHFDFRNQGDCVQDPPICLHLSHSQRTSASGLLLILEENNQVMSKDVDLRIYLFTWDMKEKDHTLDLLSINKTNSNSIAWQHWYGLQWVNRSTSLMFNIFYWQMYLSNEFHCQGLRSRKLDNE